MRFKYFNLTKTRSKHTDKTPTSEFYPGRRKFVKTMGLGALALNPIKNTLNTMIHESIVFNESQNRLKVWLNNQLVWEISEKYFEPGYSVFLKEEQDFFLINAKNLQPRKTSLNFSLKAVINNKNGFWNADFFIPEFNFHWEGNFKHWLEGITLASANGTFNQDILLINETEKIKLDGNSKVQLTPNWKIEFITDEKITFHFNRKLYITNQVSVQPLGNTWPDFLISNNNNFTIIQLLNFTQWNSFIENQNLNGGYFFSKEEIKGNINLALPYMRKNKLMWAGNENAPFFFVADKVAENQIQLENFFYYAEYLNKKPAQNYIAASLPQNGYWITNKLGAFKLEKDEKIPDFEAFGTGHFFEEVVLEPRLHAFKPIIGNAITINTVYQDPPKVRIVQPQKKVTRTTTVEPATNQTNQREENSRQPNENTTNEKPQQPERNITIPIEIQQNQQRPVREVQQNQPIISVEFDRLKFKPKNALSVIVMRPEDMVLLEFVFHNFNFTNKGQSPFLELDKPKENGVVEIYFQSQHTLEEAYFESTPIPDPDPMKPAESGVRLPAKHLRARKTRLVYELPAGHEGFPLIMDELLDWTKFSLRVHPRAWIKLPSLRPIRIPARISRDNKTTIQPNKNLKYLETPSTEYGIRLAQNTKLKSNNLEIYNENEVSKVLTSVTATSVRSSFNIASIKNLNLVVGPIPELSTSIEAPTLLYISPNQTNDFYHKTKVTLRDVEELRITTQQILSPQLRVYDPLSTNKGEITELWHTRLGVKLKNGKTSGSALPHLRTIRALWADDAEKDYKVAKERNYPFMASLDANNRQKLVHTTSNYSLGFEPFPVPVNDLMLTTLGAYLDWHAFFDVPNPQDTYLNIIEWEHVATLGRDHFVKIVEEGYLFPFGHRAAIVKITERKFDNQTKAAANRQRMFVVVLEKEVLYSRNDPEGKFIEFPFQAVRIETNATPNIDNPEESTLITVPVSNNLTRVTRLRINGASANTTYNFYINVGKQGFPFDIVATDKEGHEHPFRMPLAFMENRIARDKSLMQNVIEVYRGKQSDNFNKLYNEAAFNGQEVAYAEYLVDGDTDFETENIKFDAQIYPVNGEGELKFHPKIKEAKVFVKQINELTGVREPATISLEDDNNKGGVFAKVTSKNVVDFSGGSDKAGGFLLPNMSVSGLSKLQGPVSGKLDDMKNLMFIPDDFFKAFEDLPVAKIFGVIEIFSLLFGTESSPLDLGGSFNNMINAVSKIREEIENLKNEILYLENLGQETQQAVENQINDLKQMIKNKVNELLTALNDSIPRIPNLKAFLTEEAFYAEYKWQPELGGKTIEVFPGLLNVNVNNPSNALTISTKFEKPFDAAKPAAMNGVARFEKFGIDIVPLLAVNFNYLEFRSGSSQKTDVKVDIDASNPIEFKGVLNFVNNLQSIIPVGGFSDDGPYIDLKPTGITAGFNISIPNVEVGICMISNISLGANITLPFTGAPLTMGFNFCRRENPFMLTISCFGGGGYFMMVTSLKGIQSIEAAFEFGAAMSLNVGVASGGVSAMGGFYYKMEIVEGVEQTTLTGYLRLNGHLSILGLISLSLEFYLAFNAVIYQGKVQKLEGVATLKVKVEIAFFSKTVKVSVRRELKGADADPKFVEMIDQNDWQEYCLAFAG